MAKTHRVLAILSAIGLSNKVNSTLYTDLEFSFFFLLFNPLALRKANIVYNIGSSECNRVYLGIHTGTL